MVYGKEKGRSQKGALGRHDQGVGHHLQENLLDERTEADKQSGTDVTGAVRRQGQELTPLKHSLDLWIFYTEKERKPDQILKFWWSEAHREQLTLSHVSI